MKKPRCKTVLFGLMLGMIGLGTGCSSFRLSSTPGADIYENDEKIGHTPFSFNVMSGERTFVLKRFCYVEEELTVSPLDRRKIHIDLYMIGKTRIDSEPPSAQVVRLEDGEVLGTTPCALFLERSDRVVLKLRGHEHFERDLIPNQNYMVKLKPLPGYQATYYRVVDFVSDQGNVEIYDRSAGVKLGRTPVNLRVRAGTDLEYRLEGYEPGFDIISRQAPRRIEIKLQSLTSVLLEEPEGAEVYRAGGSEKIGTIPFHVETEGNALYDIKKEGFHDHSIALSPDSPASMSIDLKEITYKTIQTNPPGADVYRLGGLEKIGTAPLSLVIEGERVFEIKKEGYHSTVVGIGPSSSSTLNVSLSPVPVEDPNAAAVGTLSVDMVESF